MTSCTCRTALPWRPKTTSRYGEEFSSIGACHTAYTTRYGSTSHIKFFDFYKDGITAALTQYQSVGSAIDTWPVLCWMGPYDDAQFQTVLNYFGSRNRYWIAAYYMEPQSAGIDGDADAQPGYYCRQYALMDQGRKTNTYGYGKYCFLLKNLAGSPQLTGPTPGYAWQNYDGGQRFSNMFIGSDIYSRAFRTAPFTGAQCLSWLVDWSNASGMQACVPEMGVDWRVTSGEMTVQQHIDAVDNIFQYAKTHNFAWVNYWNLSSVNNPGSYNLDDTIKPGIPRYELTRPAEITYWNSMRTSPLGPPSSW